MLDLGTVLPGSTQYIPFNTFDSNDPSASVTISGLALADIKVFKDGGATERASTSGFTLLDTDGIDFSGETGVHGISIDLADNTTANFWEAGSQYWVVIGPITVDAATVNFIAARFRIGYPGALLDTTIATLSTQQSFTLEEGSTDNDAYNGWVAVIHDLASSVQLAVGYVSDYVGSTKTISLAADPAIFTMAAGDNISLFRPSQVDSWNGVPLQTTNPLPNADAEAAGGLFTRGTGAGQINQDANGRVDVNIEAISADAGAPANLEADYDGTGYNKSASTIGTTTTNTDMRGTDNAALASVLGALTDAAADGDPTTVDTLMQYVKQLINILIGTSGIASFPAAAAPAAAVSLAEVIRAIYDDSNDMQPKLGTPAGASISADIAQVDTVVDGIQTDLDNGVDGLGAIKATADAIETDTQAIETDTADIQTRLPAALVSGKMDSDATAISGDTTAADRLEALMDGVLTAAAEGTPSTTVIQTDLAETTDDQYIGRLVTFLTGAAAGEQTDITGYTGSTGTITVTALANAPSAGDLMVVH